MLAALAAGIDTAATCGNRLTSNDKVVSSATQLIRYRNLDARRSGRDKMVVALFISIPSVCQNISWVSEVWALSFAFQRAASAARAACVDSYHDG